MSTHYAKSQRPSEVKIVMFLHAQLLKRSNFQICLGGLGDPRQVQVIVKVSSLRHAPNFVSGGALDEFWIGFVMAALHRIQCGDDFIRGTFRAQAGLGRV
jgi:hypothetical protein